VRQSMIANYLKRCTGNTWYAFQVHPADNSSGPNSPFHVTATPTSRSTEATSRVTVTGVGSEIGEVCANSTAVLYQTEWILGTLENLAANMFPNLGGNFAAGIAFTVPIFRNKSTLGLTGRLLLGSPVARLLVFRSLVEG
jgi:hypothetical protein